MLENPPWGLKGGNILLASKMRCSNLLVDGAAFGRHQRQLDERKLEFVEYGSTLGQVLGSPALLQVLEPLQDGRKRWRTHYTEILIFKTIQNTTIFK